MFDRMLAGLSAAGVILAVILQPLMRYADPQHLLAGGLMLTLGIGTTAAFRTIKFNTAAVALNIFTVLLGVVVLAASALGAADVSKANDLRCAQVQTAMLRPKPNTRDDIADVYQSLGCRPQGTIPSLPLRAGASSWYRGPPPEPEDMIAHEKAWVDREVVLVKPNSSPSATSTPTPRLKAAQTQFQPNTKLPSGENR